MKKRTLISWLMAGIASIGWKLFIWGNQTTQERYWKEIWEQENRERAKSFPEQPEENLWFNTIDGVQPTEFMPVFYTQIGAEGLYNPVSETLYYAPALNRKWIFVFACKTNAERFVEGQNKILLRRRVTRE